MRVIHLPESSDRLRVLNDSLKTDILLITDDVTPTDGWEQALCDCYEQADILGMTMLYPDGKVQDSGYDLMRVDGRVELVPYQRGEPYGCFYNDLPRFRECTTVCGCFLFVKADVWAKVPRFEYGMGRWEEFIFTQRAKHHGFTVGVINHPCYHQATATKQGVSTSWLVEKPLWDWVVRAVVGEKDIVGEIETEIDGELEAVLQHERVLLYGAGTIADLLWRRYARQGWRICSGYAEDTNKRWHGITVEYYQNVDPSSFDVVLTTVPGIRPVLDGYQVHKEKGTLKCRTTGNDYMI